VRLRDPGPGLSAQARVLAAADAVADACRAERVPAIVGSLDDARAGALLSLDRRASADRVLTAVCGRIRQLLGRPADQRDGQVIAAGSVAESMRDARRSFLEAQQVADAAAADPGAFGAMPPDAHPAGPGTPGGPAASGAKAPDAHAATARPAASPFYRLADLRLRGLLQLLRDDPRLQGFAERELGSLLTYDARHGTALTSVLAAYLEAGGNKAETAHRAHLARPTLYERLRHIERVLGVSLDSAQSRTSLHVALLALESARAGTEPSHAGRPRMPGDPA